MRSVHQVIGLVFVITAMTGVVANAQPSAPPDPQAKARALELFDQSDVHYKRGEFEQAAQLLRQAYDIYPEPLLLYNLARALEGMGDLTGAIEQYEKYLELATDIVDRPAIERRLATLKEQQRKAAAGGGPGPKPPTGNGDLGPQDVPHKPSFIPWVIASAGGATVIAGGVFGVLANRKHEAAVDEPVQAEAEKLQSKAESYATTANILFVVGGAVAIGGAVWGVIELRRGGSRKQEAPRKTGGARLKVAPAYVGVEWTLP